MAIKPLLSVGVKPENAPKVDDRPEEERIKNPYFSHYEAKCIHCRTDWACDKLEDFDKPAASKCTHKDGHVWSDPKPIWAPNDGSHWLDFEGGQIAF